MSINKFLCKHFDPCDQGYVTIFDIVAMIGMYVIIGLVALAILTCIGMTAIVAVYPDGDYSLPITTQSMVVSALVGLLVVCIVSVIVSVAVYIAAYRVAECPRRPN